MKIMKKKGVRMKNVVTRPEPGRRFSVDVDLVITYASSQSRMYTLSAKKQGGRMPQFYVNRKNIDPNSFQLKGGDVLTWEEGNGVDYSCVNLTNIRGLNNEN